MLLLLSIVLIYIFIRFLPEARKCDFFARHNVLVLLGMGHALHAHQPHCVPNGPDDSSCDVVRADVELHQHQRAGDESLHGPRVHFVDELRMATTPATVEMLPDAMHCVCSIATQRMGHLPLCAAYAGAALGEHADATRLIIHEDAVWFVRILLCDVRRVHFIENVAPNVNRS